MKPPGPLLICLTAFACGDPGGRGPPEPDRDVGDGTHVTVQDAAGQVHRFDRPPSRIVSLVPSATEILETLGARDQLVGRTEFDTATVLATLPSVGRGLGPSLEVLVSLEPDLVVRFAGEADQRTAERLSALGLQHFAVRPERIQDVRTVVAQFGRVLRRDAAADSLLAAMDSALAHVALRVEGRSPPSVAYLFGGDPPWAAGPDTFIDELIELAGGRNAFADLGTRYATVSAEELVARQIDLILIPRGTGQETPGGIPRYEVSPLTQLPGPRLGEAARELALILHPEAFR